MPLFQLIQEGNLYSFSMKRRLSVVLATIGDPKICYLDEPTTGMDPINRRHVWKFIEEFKRDKVIILTTHSMEEAEVLGDRIGIMAHGRLRALGTPAVLKHNNSVGYKFSILTSPSTLYQAKQEIYLRAPEAILEDDGAGALIYQFPPSMDPFIPQFIKYLNDDPKKLIQAWGLSETSLEQIFLRIVRQYQQEIMIHGEG